MNQNKNHKTRKKWPILSVIFKNRPMLTRASLINIPVLTRNSTAVLCTAFILFVSSSVFAAGLTSPGSPKQVATFAAGLTNPGSPKQVATSAAGLANLGSPKQIAILVSADDLLNLEAPEKVTAGEDFALSLRTGGQFPFLMNEDAAFFESYEGGRPRLAGIRTLDNQGTASMQLRKGKAGIYHYSVLVGPFQSEITVTVLPGQPAAIRKTQERLFLEVGRRATVEFAIKDAYGNIVLPGSTAEQQMTANRLLTLTITDPEQNLLPETEFALTPSSEGNLVVSFVAEKKGNYLVKAHLVNDAGISARGLICAREPGAVTSIELAVQNGKEPFLRISKNRLQPGQLELEAILRGENNIPKTPSPEEEQGIIFSTDRPDLLQVEGRMGGKAVLIEKGKSGPATVYLTYVAEGKGMQKSIPLWITGDPAQIKLEAKTNDLTAEVEATLLDKKGEPAWETTKDCRLDVPAGLRITAQTDLARGQAKYVLEAEEYGSYTVGFTAEKELYHSLQIDFLEKAKPAQHVVIFIGQESYIKDGQPAKMSTAPEISSGRVFAPVDFFADAFNMEVSPFPETEKIALQSPDGMNIIIDQGAQQLTVTNTADGTTMTTPISTFFMQKNAGTYFVPAGIVARLFGIKVDYLPKRDQIEHVSFVRK